MDFSEICQVFGGTIFYEDMRGNLAAISAYLDSRRAKLHFPDLAEVASLLLLRALYNMWIGDFGLAERYLTALREDNIFGHRWTMRAWAYTGLLYTWLEAPPYLKHCMIYGPAMKTGKWRFAQLGKPSGANEALSRADQAWHRSKPGTQPDDSSLALENLIIRLHCGARCMMPWSFPVDTFYEEWNEAEIHRDQQTGEAAKTRGGWIEMTQGVATSLHMANYESMACHMLRLQEDVELIQTGTHEALVGPKDGIDRGLDCMRRGDRAISSDITSPLCYNLNIGDKFEKLDSDSGMFHAVALSKGSARRSYIQLLNQAYQADAYYAQAQSHFEHDQSARGVAAVCLRRACVARILSLNPIQKWNPSQEYSNHRESSSLALKMLNQVGSVADAVKDTPLKMLSTLHQIFWFQGNWKTTARDFALWATQSKNEGFLLGAALLALSLGRYCRYILGDPIMAYEALTVAYWLLESSKDSCVTLWAEINFAVMSLYKSIGMHKEAGTPVYIVSSFLDKVMREDDPDHIAFWTSPTTEMFRARLFQFTVERTMSLGPQTDNPSLFPYPPAQRFLDNWRNHGTENLRPELVTWLDHQQVRKQYLTALKSYKRYCQEVRPEQAHESLQSFLDHCGLRERADVQTRAYRIDIASRLDNEEVALGILSSIRDDDCIPVYYRMQGTRSQSRDLTRRKLKSLEIILLACIRTKQWQRADEVMALLATHAPGYFTSTSCQTNKWPWLRCLYAGLVHEHRGRYTHAECYYTQSYMFLLKQRLQLGSDSERDFCARANVSRVASSSARMHLLGSQEDERHYCSVSEAVQDTGVDTGVYTAFRRTSCSTRSAVDMLEAARPGNIWTQRPSQRVWTEEALQARYDYMCFLELVAKVGRSDEEEKEFRRLLPGLETYRASFETGSHEQKYDDRFGDLSTDIPENALVIYSDLSHEGLLLLAMSKDYTILEHRIDRTVTPTSMQDLVLRYLRAILDDTKSSTSVSAALEFNARAISAKIIDPVQQWIAEKDHIIFVPSGVLSRLPFSILLYKGQYLVLQKQVSQVSSLRTLKHLQQQHARTSHGGKTSAVVIARPGNRRQQWLPMAGIEAKVVASMLGAPAINAQDVGRSEMQHYIGTSDVLHVCTHGLSDADFPLNSNILLKESFRVLDMLRVRNTIDLVTFSTCLSGVGHASEQGEVQGFSSYVLEAGARAYIGALWKVPDVVSMLHMIFFYRRLTASLKTPTVAEAWHGACIELYEMTPEKTITLLQQLVGQWDEWEKLGEKPAVFIGGNGKRVLSNLITDLKSGKVDPIDFKHPKSVGAFQVVGDGSLVIGDQDPVHGAPLPNEEVE